MKNNLADLNNHLFAMLEKKEEHKELLTLPNWNNEIFREISGIDAEAEIAKEAED